MHLSTRRQISLESRSIWWFLCSTKRALPVQGTRSARQMFWSWTLSLKYVQLRLSQVIRRRHQVRTVTVAAIERGQKTATASSEELVKAAAAADLFFQSRVATRLGRPPSKPPITLGKERLQHKKEQKNQEEDEDEKGEKQVKSKHEKNTTEKKEQANTRRRRRRLLSTSRNVRRRRDRL